MKSETTLDLMQELLTRLDFQGTSFTWKVEFLPAKGRKSGKAGSIDFSGYDVITFKGKRFKVHRLVWLLIHGAPLPEVIDHIDGDKSNNSPDNLRPSTTRLNGANRVEHRRGKPVGVSYRKDNKMWIAQRWQDGKKLYLGQYKTQQEAYNAYVESLGEGKW